ncbi:MAG: Dabb family protein [Micrococcales bacterium]|nr:Dabb family protein [Micrococcales bacterium]MCL2668644.1 Dabb family protein [Micrococcales bacterium]
MIRHVVMWTFADQAAGADRAANLARAAEKVAALDGLVPGMRHLEVVVAPEHLNHTHDLLLIVDFDSADDLAAYRTHPRHVEVASFITAACADRAVVDYEVP